MHTYYLDILLQEWAEIFSARPTLQNQYFKDCIFLSLRKSEKLC